MSFQNLGRFWWIILLLTFASRTNSFSQEAIATESIQESPEAITILVTGDALPDDASAESLERVTALNNHPLKLITEAEAAHDPAVKPHLRLTFDRDQGKILIELLSHPLRERSPILMDLPEPAVLSSSIDEEAALTGFTGYDAIDIQAAIIALYALYVAGDCDEATTASVFLTTQQTQIPEESLTATLEAAFNPGSHLMGFRSLLALNCALLDETFDFDLLLLTNPNAWYGSPHLDIAATSNIAWVYLQAGDQAAAFAKLDALAERWSDDLYATVEILRKRSQFHALVNDFDSAMEAVQEAIDMAEDAEELPIRKLAGLYIQRGQVHTLLYEWDNAVADYTTAIELAPENEMVAEAVAEAYYYRGFIYYTTLFDRERALPDFERYLELAPYGEHREEAMQYREDIQAELKALSG
jgi:tetratricopeptide (TPR) repeat protein